MPTIPYPTPGFPLTLTLPYPLTLPLNPYHAQLSLVRLLQIHPTNRSVDHRWRAHPYLPNAGDAVGREEEADDGLILQLFLMLLVEGLGLDESQVIPNDLQTPQVLMTHWHSLWFQCPYFHLLGNGGVQVSEKSKDVMAGLKEGEIYECEVSQDEGRTEISR